MIIRWVKAWRESRKRKAEDVAHRREVAQHLRMLAAEGRTLSIDVANNVVNDADLLLVRLIESKCQFLDDLADKTERGEVEVNDEWPEVIGG